MKENIKIKGQLKLFLSWPLLLSLFLISGNITVAALNKTSGFLLLPFTLCYLIAAVVICLHQKRRILSLDSEAAFSRDGSSLWIGR